MKVVGSNKITPLFTIDIPRLEQPDFDSRGLGTAHKLHVVWGLHRLLLYLVLRACNL